MVIKTTSVADELRTFSLAIRESDESIERAISTLSSFFQNFIDKTYRSLLEETVELSRQNLEKGQRLIELETFHRAQIKAYDERTETLIERLEKISGTCSALQGENSLLKRDLTALNTEVTQFKTQWTQADLHIRNSFGAQQVQIEASTRHSAAVTDQVTAVKTDLEALTERVTDVVDTYNGHTHFRRLGYGRTDAPDQKI
jgi:chromosome segregation ATPase